ncbi:hypothetical protein FEM48_Zijuj01G0115700 [Ziziphus jujuba var. spinosa]|uniref:Uncharacterized protein n=1 Tax=Ziziphus jujuba var. spinosa TaxID=714518 RepID=A0A978W115_ZIZJJ|nr:hypothetical protein FEM48_Zijuj01G0115700 [Ziziphus jujuba var. spinosa]
MTSVRHIAVCGMISQYNVDEHEGVRNPMHLLSKRAHMEGFNCLDHLHKYFDCLDFILPYIRQGKIVYVEDVAHGLDSASSVTVGLFSGRNVKKKKKKKLIHLSD